MIKVTSIQTLLNKLIKILIVNNDNLSAIQLIDEYLDDSTKVFSMYFTEEDIQVIEHSLFISVIMLINSLPLEALENLKPIRKILDNIYIKNLWMSTRLLKESENPYDLGTLYDLPTLVKFEIHKIILSSF
jgi:hypothetical protein